MSFLIVQFKIQINSRLNCKEIGIFDVFLQKEIHFEIFPLLKRKTRQIIAGS
jgi:hypothetical protein